MLWQRILIGVAVAIVLSGSLSVLAHYALVDLFGKRVSSVKYGRLTEHRYLVDQKTRKRIRWGTLTFFLVVAILWFACAWSTILTPEHFSELLQMTGPQ